MKGYEYRIGPLEGPGGEWTGQTCYYYVPQKAVLSMPGERSWRMGTSWTGHGLGGRGAHGLGGEMGRWPGIFTSTGVAETVLDGEGVPRVRDCKRVALAGAKRPAGGLPLFEQQDERGVVASGLAGAFGQANIGYPINFKQHVSQ